MSLKCVQSASSRHVDIQQDQIVFCLGQPFHHFIGIRGNAELRRGKRIRKDFLQATPRGRMIIGNQDIHRFTHRVGSQSTCKIGGRARLGTGGTI